MSKRRSYFENFSTGSLIVLLKQSQKELEELILVEKTNPYLITRIKDLKFFIKALKNILVKRYMDANITLKETAKKVVENKGIVEEVFKEIFVLKVIDKEEIIDYELLEKVINKLNIE